jgi:hypothetical protein
MTGPVLSVFIDDAQLPRTQARLLEALVRRSSMPVEVCWTSSLRLPGWGRWGVEAEIARRLAARGAILQGVGRGERSIYLDGKLLLNGDLAELHEASAHCRVLADCSRRLGQWQFFVVNNRRSPDKEEREWLQGFWELDYQQVSECNFGATDLPQGWIPRAINDSRCSKVVSLERVEERPWHSAYAPAGRTWCRLLLALLDENLLVRSELEQESSRGLVRPSLLYQVERGIEDPLRLPTGIRELDLTYVCPEFAVTPAQHRMLSEHRFAIPKRPKKAVKRSKLRAAWGVLSRIPRRALQATGYALTHGYLEERDTKAVRRLYKRHVRPRLRLLFWMLRSGKRCFRRARLGFAVVRLRRGSECQHPSVEV